MLKPPSTKGEFTKDKVRALIAIAIFSALFFGIKNTFFKQDEPKGPEMIIYRGTDTIRINISDSLKWDSLMKSLSSPPSMEDDSLYKVYELDKYDSLRDTTISPLVDSLLQEWGIYA